MLQHPIPQNISTYQFRLIGDMTLKQFFILISGIGIAILTYNTNLFAPIKFGIILISVIIGFVGAFLPIEERPLDQWFVAFIRAIYRPTQYLWRRQYNIPGYFTYSVVPGKIQPLDSPDIAAQVIQRKREGLKSFLQTLPGHKQLSVLEQQESSSLNTLTSLFSSPTPIPRITPVHPQPSPLASPHPQTITPPLSPASPTLTVKPPAPTPPPIRVTPIQPVSVEHISLPTTLFQATPSANPTSQPATLEPQPIPQMSSPLIPKGPPQPTTSIKTDSSLPFPAAPTTPNTVIGMVLDKSGKIIDNAIVEIRDENRIPVRATKTNKLGQFFSTTPLKNGSYELEVEKSRHVFSVTKIEAIGKIIPPLKIQAVS